MIDRVVGVSVNPVLIEDEVRDAYKFTRGFDLLPADNEKAVKYPLRTRLARIGEWVTGVMVVPGAGYGLTAAARDDMRGMVVGIVAATAACITAMGLKAYADRQLSYVDVDYEDAQRQAGNVAAPLSHEPTTLELAGIFPEGWDQP